MGVPELLVVELLGVFELLEFVFGDCHVQPKVGNTNTTGRNRNERAAMPSREITPSLLAQHTS
jgi:hypothetical protein